MVRLSLIDLNLNWFTDRPSNVRIPGLSCKLALVNLNNNYRILLVNPPRREAPMPQVEALPAGLKRDLAPAPLETTSGQGR